GWRMASQCAGQKAPLFDHLVGSGLQRQWHRKAGGHGPSESATSIAASRNSSVRVRSSIDRANTMPPTQSAPRTGRHRTLHGVRKYREPKYVPEHIQMLLEHIARLSNPKSIYDLIGN